MIQNCWFVHDGKLWSFLLQWAVLYLWLMLGVVYCTVVVLVTIVKLTRDALMLEQIMARVGSSIRTKWYGNESGVGGSAAAGNTTTGSSDGGGGGGGGGGDVEAPGTTVRKTTMAAELDYFVRKVMWYPLMPLVCQSGEVIFAMEGYFNGKPSDSLLAYTYVGPALQGMFGLLVFLMDPAMKALWLNMTGKRDMLYDNVYRRNRILNEATLKDTIGKTPLLLPSVTAVIEKKLGALKVSKGDGAREDGNKNVVSASPEERSMWISSVEVGMEQMDVMVGRKTLRLV